MSGSQQEQDLIYDWNRRQAPSAPAARIQLDDETLRDGLQSPSVTDPPVEWKKRLLHVMDRLGIDTADVGLPGAGPRAVQYLIRGAKARCVLHGNYMASTEDVETVAEPVLFHRILTNFHARSEGMDSAEVVKKLVEDTRKENR